LKRPEPETGNRVCLEEPGVSARRPARAFELDALRGLALFMMLLHHLIFDLRYMLGLDVFAFQETWWFENLLRPLFLNVFLIVSGICCSFSRSNTRRGIRLLAVALAFTLFTSLFSLWTNTDLYILFNVLHLLAFGTLIYAGLNHVEQKRGVRLLRVDVTLLLLMGVLLWLASLLPHWVGQGSYWLLPFGLVPNPVVGMADYLPLIPWLGFFFMGALIGRVAYTRNCSAFPNAPAWLVAVSGLFGFIGRHSLLIYALHQPAFLAILFGLRAIGLI
jgi:uncharacterized membrane protein